MGAITDYNVHDLNMGMQKLNQFCYLSDVSSED